MKAGGCLHYVSQLSADMMYGVYDQRLFFFLQRQTRNCSFKVQTHAFMQHIFPERANMMQEFVPV